MGFEIKEAENALIATNHDVSKSLQLLTARYGPGADAAFKAHAPVCICHTQRIKLMPSIAWLSLFSHDVTVDAQAEAYDEAVVQLMDMGFKYEQVKDALKVAGNDVATATQLLLVDSTQYA